MCSHLQQPARCAAGKLRNGRLYPHLGHLAEQAHEVVFLQPVVSLAAGVGQVRIQITEARGFVWLPREERQHVAVHVHVQASCEQTHDAEQP